MSDRIYEIKAVVTLWEGAEPLDAPMLNRLLTEGGDITDVERIEIREMA